jgi:hypothetical protein
MRNHLFSKALIGFLLLLFCAPTVRAGEPCCHILICCRGNNDGMTFLVDGKWNPAHDYRDINQVSDILQKIKDAGVNNVIIDMTNASQWTHLWAIYQPMVNNVQKVCQEKKMKFFIFIGAAFTEPDKKKLTMSQFAFWNAMAKNVWEMWAQDPAYKRYGYGDDRPILIVFQPADVYWERYKAAPESEKTYLSKFHIGTTQVNSPILSGKSDGWGYRNYSQSVDGKVRFACPNKGVPPADWGRISREDWIKRVKWASEAEEYSIYGSYDDVCDAIHWGIADTKNCTVAHKKYPDDQPYCYYDVVKEILTLSVSNNQIRK